MTADPTTFANATQGGLNTGGSQLNSTFWSDWKKGVLSGSNMGGSGGLGSTAGSLGGSAIGTAIAGPLGGVIGGQLGGGLGDMGMGGLLGSGESGEDKYMEEKAQSEHETRRWEERNAAPTAGIGNYLMRAYATQGMPILGALNNLDFYFNKIVPYLKSYGKTDKRGNPRG